MGYSKAEDILWSQKWEADELLKARSYALKTWTMQEAEKISKKHMLHLRCLTFGTAAEKKVHLKYKTAEQLW